MWQTHRHTTTAYTALSIASRGKNWQDIDRHSIRSALVCKRLYYSTVCDVFFPVFTITQRYRQRIVIPRARLTQGPPKTISVEITHGAATLCRRLQIKIHWEFAWMWSIVRRILATRRAVEWASEHCRVQFSCCKITTYELQQQQQQRRTRINDRSVLLHPFIRRRQSVSPRILLLPQSSYGRLDSTQPILKELAAKSRGGRVSTGPHFGADVRDRRLNDRLSAIIRPAGPRRGWTDSLGAVVR